MPEYTFKTLYFPANRTRSGSPAKVTISLPREPIRPNITQAFVEYVHALSGSDIRAALGDPFLEDLEQFAGSERRSLSNTCVYRLLEAFKRSGTGGHKTNGVKQGLLPFFEEQPEEPDGAVAEERDGAADEGGFGVTFRESKRLPVHNWYPYVEGFAAHYIRDALLRFGSTPSSVYDPFGGAGTTQLTASMMQIPAYYAEVNPFMVFVAETKVNGSAWVRNNLPAVRKVCSRFLERLDVATLDQLGAQIDLASYEAAFPSRDFFVERDLRHLLAAKALAEETAGKEPRARDLLLLACAANVVRSSNMTRRADLRRRRPDEYKDRVVNVATFIRESVERILDDVEQLPPSMAPMTRVANDSRQLGADWEGKFDAVITSPPYLNGTNYIRNTKLELWYLGYLSSEAQLADYRRQTVCAGINDVSRARDRYTHFERVEEVAGQLDRQTKDRRIPIMVRHYFSDMSQVLGGAFRALIPGGRFILDIGDSQFYGVHVPTDELLLDAVRSVGFDVEHKHLLARRYSKGNVELKQVELVLRKPKGSRTLALTRPQTESIESRIEQFAEKLPFRSEPYVSRNWGHPLHSLCSYQGKLKPGLGYWLIHSFVPPASSVLDPLGGVGTIPFEAAQAGHRAVSNDKSPFASVIAAAKLNPPSLADALAALESFGRRLRATTLTDKDYQDARFGLNSSVADYYHKETLDEVLKARRLFLREGWGDQVHTFLWASLLHILHGNRPYALSRNSHPVTPFAPSGPTEYRSLMDRLRGRFERALEEPLPATFRPGTGLHGDFRALPGKCKEPFDAIITSPPFMGMRFDRPNWLRMWFCGWGERSFHEDSLLFLERQQTQSLHCYAEFFDTCRRMIKPDGLLIVHIGSGSNDRKMIPGLMAKASAHFGLIADVKEDVQDVEKHGLKDKGRTETQHLLFLRPQ